MDQHGLSFTRLPFRFTGRQDFGEQLARWVGQVFYEVLPAHGYELREEQIYTAYQVASAFQHGYTLLAEAGLGTGKTFAYIPPAVCYARLSGRPVIVACGSTVLLRQVAGPEGDVTRLSTVLNLDIDVAVADPAGEYLCLRRVNRLLAAPPRRGLKRCLEWAAKTKTGSRHEQPRLADSTWSQLAYTPSCRCDTCSYRQRCFMRTARRRVQQVKDLIVCSHEHFFGSLWRSTIEDRAIGELDWLPAAAGVVLDEGHRVPLAAAMAAGRRLRSARIGATLNGFAAGISRRSALTVAAGAAARAARAFCSSLDGAVEGGDEGGRQAVARTPELLARAAEFRGCIERLEDQLVIDEELSQTSEWRNQKNPYEMQLMAAGDELARSREALALLARPESEVVVWKDPAHNELWAVPRTVPELLRKHLFGIGRPVVLTSATLSAAGSFDYLARLLGLGRWRSSRAGVPFDYATQALVYYPPDLSSAVEPGWYPQAVSRLSELLHRSCGRALVLVARPSDLQRLRGECLWGRLPWSVLWEGSGHPHALVSRFRKDTSSVLVGTGFWEGVDVPGESLSLCVVFGLPFPAHDPLIRARREDANAQGLDPELAVDGPEMALKLAQGAGRLIRTRKDRGVLALLETGRGSVHEALVRASLPAGAPVTGSLDAVAAFYAHPGATGNRGPSSQCQHADGQDDQQPTHDLPEE